MVKVPPTNAIVLNPPSYDLRTYLEAACAAVRIDGWHKTSEAFPTWKRAQAILDECEMVILPEDLELADEILQYMPLVRESEYHEKLAQALTWKKLSMGNLPMVASAVISYQRWREKQALAASQTYVGKEEESIDVPYVELVKSHKFTRRVDRGYWQNRHWIDDWREEDAYVHQFVTKEGAILVCFALWPLNIRFSHIKGLVKKHRVSSFSGLKETVVAIFWLDPLPICSVCGKSTGENAECTCILANEVWYPPVGEFDIDIEEIKGAIDG